MSASPISRLAERHLEQVRACQESAPTGLQAGARAYRRCLARVYNLLIPADARVLEVGCGFLHQTGADGVDAQTLGQLDRSSSHEGVDGVSPLPGRRRGGPGTDSP